MRIGSKEEAAKSSSAPLLSADGLRIALDRDAHHELVRRGSLTVRRGEVVAVVGESGSGKSLTLRAITGLLPTGVALESGDIQVDGLDVTRANSRQLRRLRGGVVGMIFQEPMTALNPTMRVGPQIAESARMHCGLSRRRAKARAIELLGEMGFSEPDRHYRFFPHELSGGMRQRVVIAIAMAGEPALLLCDEPTTALDATVTVKVLDLILRLASERNLGVVIVTHDLGTAARICDRIVVMYAGTVVEEGPADELLKRPRHPYTYALLRAAPTRDSLAEELKAIPGSPPAPGAVPEGCPFAPRCEFAEPECEMPVSLVQIDPQRRSACRREILLASMVVTDHG